MNRFLHFIQYHNAIPLVAIVLVMGAGATFAATDPEAIYSANQQVMSIDNTYLVDKDLSTYSPRIEITGVTEDNDMYFVAYNSYTIDLKDSVWQDVTKKEVMKVSKADLGPYRDLGLYVTAQLKQQTDRELAYLKEVQAIEQKSVSYKTVATQYGGLIGKFLDTQTVELPGYTPVVLPPVPSAQVAAAGATQTSDGSTQSAALSVAPSGNPSLRIQILGNNPAQIPFKTNYIDLGAVVTDAANDNLGIHTFLNGKEVAQIQIDTSTTSVWTIRYQSTDPQGNSTSIERKVYVYDPAIGPPFQVTEAAPPEPEPVPTQDAPVAPASVPESTPDTTLSDTAATIAPPEITPPAATSTPDVPVTTAPSADVSPAATTTSDTTVPPTDTATTDATSTPTGQ